MGMEAQGGKQAGVGGKALAFVPLPFLVAPGPVLPDPASYRIEGSCCF